GPPRRAPWPRLPRRRCRHPPRRALRLASRARPLNDVLGALGALDRQLYLGIVDARNPLLAVLAIALTYLNYNGLIWWVGIVALARSRVVVGAHYPGDVLAGALLGSLSGLVAPHAVALVRRRFHWRAFVVPHTHWDREWYERFEGYRARLVPMISRLLDVLERDP